jgi:HD superfamily phosphodiesterase
MKRVNHLLIHPEFRALLAQIEAAEEGRPYCGHGLDHLLAVGRLMYLESLERNLAIPQALLYAAALVHDLGRAGEYQGTGPHQELGPQLAGPILSSCGFTSQEVALITEAITQHRSSWQGNRSQLGELLFRADKLSRPCYCCKAQATCNWPPEKRNQTLTH